MIFLIKYLYKQNVMNYKYLYATVCLVISLWIYVFYRTEQTVINHIIAWIISPAHFKELRNTITLSLPEFVIYSLPEGLWIFATTIISKKLVLKTKKISISMIYMPLIVACLIELVQYAKLSRGVFDWFDVVVIIFSWVVACAFNQTNQIKKQKEAKMVYVTFTYIIIVFSYVWK